MNEPDRKPPRWLERMFRDGQRRADAAENAERWMLELRSRYGPELLALVKHERPTPNPPSR